MRNEFQTQLSTLQTSLLHLGETVIELLERLSQSYQERNVEVLRWIAQQEQMLSHAERQIEAEALDVLLRQQPVAQDWARVGMALKTVTDWARIGVQVCDSAAILVNHLHDIDDELRMSLSMMIDDVLGMLREALQMQRLEDAQRAQLLFRLDDEVDQDFIHIRDQLVLSQLDGERKNYGFAVDALMIAKYLERMGDHACHIAHWLLFAQSGFPREH